jgi:hypothetical protein
MKRVMTPLGARSFSENSVKVMMKRNTSTLFLSVMLVGLLPATVLAAPLDLITTALEIKQPIINLPVQLKLPNTEAFCAGFSETKKKLSAAAAGEQDRLDGYLAAVDEETETRRNARDAKLGEARSVADQKRSDWYARLLDQAETDAEEEAAEEFQEDLEDAVERRRNAFDTATQNFRVSVDALRSERQAALEKARDAFQKAIAGAFENVDEDCARGQSTATLIRNFRESLTTARAELEKALPPGALKTKHRAFAATFSTAVKNANARFQEEKSAALAELEEAFASPED